MDTGAETDLISEAFAQQLGLTVAAELDTPTIKGVDGAEVRGHKAYWLTFFLIDRRGWPRKIRRAFVAIERPGSEPQLLLGRASMGLEGIVIETRTNTWLYEGISIANPEAFAEELLAGNTAYIRFVTGVLEKDKPIPSLGEDDDEVANKELLPEELREYTKVFSEGLAKALPLLEDAVHEIVLKEGATAPHKGMYPLSAGQLRTLHEYIEENLANGRIKRSTSPAGAPIIFVPKKDGTVRLCVDYRGLNAVTIKNRYPLPLIGELLDRLTGAEWMSKIDLREAYHRIAIKPEDRWKTAFRTRYGHFEYTVMPFGLTNAPATFQEYIHRALADLLDTVCVVYLDDILIYSRTREQHTADLKNVLQRLQDAELYAKLSKCEFYRQETEFLGFIVSNKGVRMDPERVRSITEWPTPKSFKDIQVFLGFANFYRKFIARYSHIARPLTAALKGSQNGTKSGDFAWGEEMEAALQELKLAFQSASMLRHYDPSRETRVETDASIRAISGIISQKHATVWHPIAYWSRKLDDPETRWGTGRQELLAIVESLEYWSHYVEGLEQRLTVLTDHQALKRVMDSPARDVRGRLARWVYRLALFDFEIQHRPGVTNPADGLSRRPDYMEGEPNVDDVLPTLAAKLRLAEDLPPGLQARIASLTVSGDVAESYVHAVKTRLRTRQAEALKGAQSQQVSSNLRGTSPIEAHRTANADHSARDNLAAQTPSYPRRSGEKASAERGEPERSEDSNSAGIVGYPVQRIPRAVVRQLIQGETAYTDGTGVDLEHVVRELQTSDDLCREITNDLRTFAGSWPGYTLDPQGTLFYKERLVIPEEASLREELLRMHHDDPRIGHLGANRTAELITRKFHWRHLIEDVRAYTAECPECQGARIPRHRPHGLLQSLPLPSHPYQQISLDFITGLPEVTGSDGQTYDAILVVVCRMTKMAHYFPTTRRLNAAGLAAIIYKNIECRFGTPEGIVSDRDKLITSHFWRDYCEAMAVKRRMSTAWHPQSDGQTERVNQELETYLRKVCGPATEPWLQALPEAEFNHNNAVNSTTKVSPFFALMGYHPRAIDYVQSSRKNLTEGVRERLAKITETRRRMAEAWQFAQERQAKYHNARRKPIEFEIGAYVGLSTKNFRFKKAERKLAPRYVRVRVVQKIGPNAYRLQLPKKYEAMHDVFSVSLLEPWNGSRQSANQLPDLEPESEEWEVEEVVAHKGEGADRLYLVKWKGWPVEYNSWEPAEHLANAPKKVAAYHARPKQSHRKWGD